MRSPGWCLSIAALAAAILAARGAQAEPSACVALRACEPGGSECDEECPIIPHAGTARRDALVVLDTEARSAAAGGDYTLAAARFVCLFRADPQAETAGSLAVVLRERGFLNRALIAARCSESLSDEGPARARAQARREDLERRVGAPRLPSPDEAARAEVEGSPSLPPPPLPLRRVASARGESTGLSSARGQPGGAAVAASRAQGAVVPARFRHAARVAAVAGAVLLVGAGATYFLARSRSNDFQTEQTEHGYTQRARDLHDSAVSWQNVTTIGLGAGLMLVGASTAVLMF